MTTASTPSFDAQPLAEAYALPAACYTAPESLERDRRAVFAHSWQLVAHTAQLEGVGDHVVTERHMASLIREAKLDVRHRTTVLTDLADLAPILVSRAA